MSTLSGQITSTSTYNQFVGYIVCIFTFNLFSRILGNLYANSNAVTVIGANVTVPDIPHVHNTTLSDKTTTTTASTTKVMMTNMQLNFLY